MARGEMRYLYVTEPDMERLQGLIEIGGGSDARYLADLEDELDHAHVVCPREVPANVITMNSTVLIEDLDTGEVKIYTIVFPGETKRVPGAVSVLAPIGTALIGCREGDVVEWDVPTGTVRLKVLEVTYQPELTGDDAA
jgi:regulator of nucleoside diphosphate kinase